MAKMPATACEGAQVSPATGEPAQPAPVESPSSPPEMEEHMTQQMQAPNDPYMGGQSAPQPPAPTKKPFFKKPWFLVLAGLTVIGIISSAISGGKGGPSATPSSDASTDASAPAGDVAASDDTAAASDTA